MKIISTIRLSMVSTYLIDLLMIVLIVVLIIKVTDHCSSIPRGEPIAFYAFGNPAGVFGLFWNCLTGNSFEVLN